MRPRIVSWLNDVFGVEIFEWLVPYPALVYALAMLACLLVFTRRSGRAGLEPHHAAGAAVAAMIGGLIGARLLLVLLFRDRFADLARALFQVHGGTISWGAYGGGLIFFVGYLLLRRQPLLAYLDVLASVIGLGPFIGRWACFLYGCDFGRVSSVSWAVTYPHGSIPFVEQVRVGLIDPLASTSFAVHPVQIYLSLNGLLLFAVFTYLWRVRTWVPGTLFFAFWAAYTCTRFFLEFFRWDARAAYLGFLSIGQVCSVGVFAVSIGSILILLRRPQC